MKLAIEIFWSFIIGLVFSMFPLLFYSGEGGYVFQLGRWWSGLFKNRSYSGFEEFWFAFVIAILVFQSVNYYRTLKD